MKTLRIPVINRVPTVLLLRAAIRLHQVVAAVVAVLLLRRLLQGAVAEAADLTVDR